jgi:hypothetical protein
MSGGDKVVIDESLVSPVSANKTPPDSASQQMITPQQNVAASNAATVPGSNNINLNTQSKTQGLNANSTSVPSTVQANTGKLNPAHGQPGHRCDIAVGAPLNSKPAPQNAVPATISTTPAPQNAAVAPGMNPAHGQPGHRCDIAVGAPLNSKPAATVTAPAQEATNTPLTITPAKADSSKN